MKKRSHTLANCIGYLALLGGVAYAWPWVLEVSPPLPGVGGSPPVGSLPPTVVAQDAVTSGSEGRGSSVAKGAAREADFGSGSTSGAPDEPEPLPPTASRPRPKAPRPVYPSGYVDGGEVLVNVPAADDSTALLLQRQLATLSEGSCVDFEDWREVAPRNVIPDGSCARYRTVMDEEVGDAAVAVGDNVVRRDDTPPPPPRIALSEESENAHTAGDTLFYRAVAGEAGTFTVAAVATDPESGVVRVVFPELGEGEPATPSVSEARATYSWSGDSSGPTEGVVVVVNGAGSSSEAPVRMVGDAAPPESGFVRYANTLHRDGSVEVTVANGEDATSGVDPASGVLEQQAAPLVGRRCRGSWSSWHPTPPGGFPERASCVRFRYRVSDNVGNAMTYTSSNVAKVVDEVRPTAAVVAPGAGSTSSGAVLVAAEAADIGFGVAAVRLEFSRAGGCHLRWRAIATLTAAPYSAEWETSALAPGRYRLRAVVVDRAGNKTASAAVTVLVPEPAPPEPLPSDQDSPPDDEPTAPDDEPTVPADDDDDAGEAPVQAPAETQPPAEGAADATESPVAEPLPASDAATPT